MASKTEVCILSCQRGRWVTHLPVRKLYSTGPGSTNQNLNRQRPMSELRYQIRIEKQLKLSRLSEAG